MTKLPIGSPLRSHLDFLTHFIVIISLLGDLCDRSVMIDLQLKVAHYIVPIAVFIYGRKSVRRSTKCLALEIESLDVILNRVSQQLDAVEPAILGPFDLCSNS
jgi:hypothetical protein